MLIIVSVAKKDSDDVKINKRLMENQDMTDFSVTEDAKKRIAITKLCTLDKIT